jgi:hypothetical protein
VIRLVGVLMLKQDDQWTVSRCYMIFANLASVSDDPVAGRQARLPD